MAKRVIMSAEIEKLRAERLSDIAYCDNYNEHPQHTEEMIVAKWLGGGTHTTTCPGNRREYPPFTPVSTNHPQGQTPMRQYTARELEQFRARNARRRMGLGN